LFLVASAVATVVLLVDDGRVRIGVSLGLVLVPVFAWASVANDEHAGQRASAGLIVALIAVVLAFAIVLPPRGSRDVWSYVMYGRILEHYGVSPYSHVPRDFPHDPFFHLVGWRDTPSVYGPVFVGIAAIGSRIAGTSALAARLFYQALSAGAVVVALALIWRRTRSPAALALLGLNPLIVLSVVSGAHNDSLVGLGILAAVLFVEDGGLRAAGLVLAAAALIKITALLALPALVVFFASKHGRRAASSLAATTLVTVGLGYALAGRAAIRALGVTHGMMTRETVWRIPRALFDASPGAPRYGLSAVDWMSAFTIAGGGVIAALAVTIAWQRRHAVHVADAVTLGLAAYLVAATYVLPWYAAWALPAAALSARRSTTRLIVGLTTFLAFNTFRQAAFPGAAGSAWWWLDVSVGPVVALLAFLAVALGKRSPIAAL
jgi:hypothetical protein